MLNASTYELVSCGTITVLIVLMRELNPSFTNPLVGIWP